MQILIELAPDIPLFIDHNVCCPLSASLSLSLSLSIYIYIYNVSACVHKYVNKVDRPKLTHTLREKKVIGS